MPHYRVYAYTQTVTTNDRGRMMKLVEILARELKEWPEECEGIFQDYDGELRFRGCSPTRSGIYASRIASDCVRQRYDIGYNGSAVTRADWEAERANINAASVITAQPAKKPNKDGWIRHRGGKCPVEAGVLVEVRLRDGQIYKGDESWPGESWGWSNEGVAGDIMAYRIHKPAEQPVIEPAVVANVHAFNERAEMRDDAKAVLGPQPVKWRDRITEIDAALAALQAERDSLVQQLAGEGFALIDRAVQPVEDMSDWRNWKVGDLICIHDVDWFAWSDFSGKPTPIVAIDDSEVPIMVGGHQWLCPNRAKFHSRPSA